MDNAAFTTQWNYPTTIWFGLGRIRDIADACVQLNIKAPMIVTDPGLTELPMIAHLQELLNEAGLHNSVYSDIKSNPTGTNVIEGCQELHDNQHDSVIAIGGGSALDTAKCIAFLANQDQALWQYEDKGDNFKKANADAILPIIAIPTTAGTGSEVGRASLIVDEETHSKRIIFHPKMLPSIVISDPELTVSLPPKLTAATGMDAFAHNLEALCAPGFHPMADGIALEGLRLIKKWLPIAYKDGNNLEARSYMLTAATMGSTAFQKGLGAIHSLSHPVGAIYGAHHGLLNAIFTPYVLRYNRPAIENKMVRLAEYLDLDDKSFNGVYQWTIDFLHQLDLPIKLSDIGVDLEHTDEIAKQALADGSTATNPVALTEPALKQLFEEAVKGKI
ncbi:MAG: iron-containing alcohol dehydrogenase [Coxiellaceae bacterium]|nr:iron-containing alcohol dehydrogenase [Coxiellaceae bacterium]